MLYRVVSLGALSNHPLRDESRPVRTGHATTTYIEAAPDGKGRGTAGRTSGSGTLRIVVDPGLPGAAVAARLDERVGVSPREITHVFLTSFQPDCRRGIAAFPNAAWLISEAEREAVGVPLAMALRDAIERVRESMGDEALRALEAGNESGAGFEPDEDGGELMLVRALQRDVAILQRCTPAPDRLARGVDLFPLPGVTPGLCGLLLNEATRTTLVCGDAIPTIEHLEQGKVLPWCADRERAQESFREAIEIADWLVLGRDNVTPSPGR